MNTSDLCGPFPTDQESGEKLVAGDGTLYHARMDVDVEQELQQGTYRCRLEWGRDGARRAAARRDIVVVVDVLRFSTAVAIALQYGALVVPCAPAAAGTTTGPYGKPGADAVQAGLPSTASDLLSPGSLRSMSPGTRLALASPNGAMCCLYGRAAPHLFVGALVNAAAVAAAATFTAGRTGLAITVVACGERRPDAGEDRALRFALEDYLGAGAILAGLPFEKSPEALVCEQTFRGAQDQLRPLLDGCSSGRELRQKGRAADVEYAAQLDCCAAVPIMRQECLKPFHPDMVR